MAYSQTIYLVQNDTLPQLKITLRDQNEAATGQTLDPDNELTWKPIVLTGATPRLKVREAGAAELTTTVTGTVIDAINGVCAFAFETGDLAGAGVYEAELEVQFASGNIQTVYDLIKLQVREEF